jgi:hypothetical protein
MNMVDKLQTIFELKKKASISVEMKQSLAYRALSDDAKIILLHLLQKKRPNYAAHNN